MQHIRNIMIYNDEDIYCRVNKQLVHTAT